MAKIIKIDYNSSKNNNLDNLIKIIYLVIIYIMGKYDVICKCCGDDKYITKLNKYHPMV